MMLKFEQFDGEYSFSKFKQNLKKLVEKGMGNMFQMEDLL